MTHYDLLIVGSGSGNSIPSADFGTIALVTDDPFGGTCLNVGCIPTKMFAHTAHIAHLTSDGQRFGVHSALTGVDWPAIRDRIFSRIDPISSGGLDYRLNHADNDNLTVYRGRGRFTGQKEFTVGDDVITADRVVIALGSRPAIPPVKGLDEVRYETSNTVMRLEQLPASMTIIGSGFIAAEFATIFSDLGVDVTVLARSEAMLRSHDADVSKVVTESFTRRGLLRTGFNTVSAWEDESGISVSDGNETVASECLLIATGRTRNSDCGMSEVGFDLDGDRLVTDEYGRVLGGGTVVDGVFAAGDITSPHMLKHVANAQMRAVEAGLRGNLTSARSDVIPSAVFARPQVASVGLTEEAARKRGPIAVGVQKFADVAYGWAMEEGDDHIVKIIADPETTAILGCHIVGPDASMLIQPIVQAMSCGQTARDIARGQYWIHPALTEVVENALLQVV